MDYQKAIEALRLEGGIEITGNPRRAAEFFDGIDVAIFAMEELMEYKQIGTLEEVREAVEKQRAKSPTYDGDGYAPDGSFVWYEWLCPHCGSRFEVDIDDYNYCPNCGQCIDWSEVEW